MKIITLAEIQALSPCYSPAKYVVDGESPSEWRGTILDVLRADQVPVLSRLWVAIRGDFFSSESLSAFKDFCGGGDSPLNAAIDQLSRSVYGLSSDERDAEFNKIQKAQIDKLIELISSD